MSEPIVIRGYRLEGGGVCPEQYNVFDENGNEVAYLRLRHGMFRADVPFHGEVVYRASPEGDGCFEDHERMKFLEEAVVAVDAKLKGK